MMGRQNDYQHKLFINGFNLDKRIRKEHILRKISENIDFDFIYKEVEDTYGINGNASVPPPVILKMMLLFFLYDIRSERGLMQIIPERLDWLWFLGCDLEDEIPNHSVWSKARARWGNGHLKDFLSTSFTNALNKVWLTVVKAFLMPASLMRMLPIILWWTPTGSKSV